MRTPLPILLGSALTPDGGATAGVVLGSTWRGPRSAWVHGRLTLTEAEAARGARRWARALFVTAVTEGGGKPQTANLTRGHAYLAPPELFRDGDLFHLPFHLDLDATLPFPLQPEPTWVHVSAREHSSEPLRLEPVERRLEASQLDGPVDALVVAYALLRDGAPDEAVSQFAAAFEWAPLREDLDAAHLYNGACAAALAKDLPRALEWLGEDVRRRATRLARLEVELVAPGLDDVRRATLVAARAAQQELLAALRDDPDLEDARDEPAFAALFEPRG